ncbi:hypothetical protein FQ330_06825 [Agrococcus sediminis]|uniref:Uncharacterized protein n=1 Tax=Agrococcus sediminis TaxID=2599924 RepID=A0A5M8QGC3_9MICO|nr:MULTISPECIES: hypothetical protein [Agrococcus]KAA6433786.1 hypothetical protein FQ330_06825 [Agrococcus sediminis]UOW00550.1 hypothetical protein MU522_11600 [Agrococcus sp. SCSIO52902]
MPRTRRDLLGLRALVGHRPSLTVLLMLLGADVMFFAGHLRASRSEFESSLSFVDIEYGHPEAFQSLQWLWAIGLVVLMAVVSRRWPVLGLLPLLGFFLLTDRYSLHERGGAALVQSLSLQGAAGLRGQDLGELMVLAAAGLVILPGLVLGIRAARRAERRDLARTLGIAGIILCCGVVLDAVHILVIAEPKTGDAFGLIEDGGEMLGASLLVAHLFRMWLQPAAAAAPVAAEPALPEPVSVQG